MPDQKPTLEYATPPKQRTPIWMPITGIVVATGVGISVMRGVFFFRTFRPNSLGPFDGPYGEPIATAVMFFSGLPVGFARWYFLERRWRRKRDGICGQDRD